MLFFSINGPEAEVEVVSYPDILGDNYYRSFVPTLCGETVELWTQLDPLHKGHGMAPWCTRIVSCQTADDKTHYPKLLPGMAPLDEGHLYHSQNETEALGAHIQAIFTLSRRSESVMDSSGPESLGIAWE